MLRRQRKYAARQGDRVVRLPRRRPRRRTRRAPAESVWRPWRKVGLLAVLAIAVVGGREWAAVAHSIASGSTDCSVARVVDGDTVKLYCPGEGLMTARLLGLDTPEIYSPSCLSEWALGQQATFALRRKLWAADEVRMVFGGRDRYDRRLMRLYLDGADVAPAMVAEGYARPYDGGRRSGWCG